MTLKQEQQEQQERQEQQPALKNRRYVLAQRPTTLPDSTHFTVETLPVTAAADDQILVRILLVALSPWQGQRLKDFKNYTTPFAIGELIDCDVLGEVIESNADGFAVGDRVTGRLGWQEYALASPQQLLRVDNEFDETVWLSALSSPGLTAYCALDLFARSMPGQTMVVTSAAGSVGSYAVQLGKLMGMRVIGIAGSDDKCSLVADTLQADASLNYNHSDFPAQLANACSNGADLVFDTVGGNVADAVFDKLNKYATVLIVGRTASNNSSEPQHDYVNMRQLWAREATIHGFSRYSYPRQWDNARLRMQDLFRQGLLKTIDNVVDGFDNTPQALHDMLAGHYTGKVMVRYAHSE
jgi:NADPH-dependent curcumin reductase CurA